MMATILAASLAFTAPSGLLDGARGGDYRASSDAELRDTRALFARTLRSVDPAGLVNDWRELGFELRNVSADAAIWSVSESEDRREGRGLYLLRVGPAEPESVALQAPHGVESDDMLTGSIALALFERRGIKAGAWSTIPREEIDLAHSDSTVFHQFTLAFADVFPGGMVVQVHGYRKSRRESSEARRVEAILSHGVRKPSRVLESRARCLGRTLRLPAGKFPDIPELGATTNDQGRALRAAGGPTFLHVELSYELRKRLIAHPEDLDRLGDCLLEVRS